MRYHQRQPRESDLSDATANGPLEPGQVVERYEVECLLGQGPLAAVYRVRHTKLDTVYALKLLTVRRSKRIRARMLDEGRTQAHLAHPNIARVFDALEVDGMPALLLEHVSGPTLAAHLDGKALPLDEAEALFRQIVAGVKAAHDLGVVHRDLKPANILLQPTESGFVPKVSDFGIAKALSDDDTSADPRADVFALGCMLYEMVCGRPAFEGDNARAAIDGELPDRIRDTIEGCLHTDPEERIADCAEILDSLDGKRRVAPSTPPATAPPPWVPLAAAAAVLVIGLGTSGALALGGIAWWARGASEPEPIEGPCPGPRGEVVGWTWAGRSIDVDEGEVWEVDQDRNVRAEPDPNAEVVCVLTKGTKLRIDAPLERPPGAVWVPVVAGSIE